MPLTEPTNAELAAALRKLLNTVAEMRCAKPEVADPEDTSDDDHWFGEFSNGAHDFGGHYGFDRNYIAWPNLSIVAAEAAAVLATVPA